MNFFIFFTFSTFASCTLGTNYYNNGNKYCFKFTWPGSLIDEDLKKKVNCTEKEKLGIPCIEPIESQTLPNLGEIWLNETRNENTNETTKETYRCILAKGYSCIKYTYSFDDAITNVTYFCGKMIENKETAVQDGCFTQKIGGYVIETCACQSTAYGDGMPCNSSTKLSFSFMVLIATLLLLNII